MGWLPEYILGKLEFVRYLKMITDIVFFFSASQFIDPKSGICASLFFQMLPPVDEVALKILDEVEAALYLEIGPA